MATMRVQLLEFLASLALQGTQREVAFERDHVI